jgi:hypothetical protein
MNERRERLSRVFNEEKKEKKNFELRLTSQKLRKLFFKNEKRKKIAIERVECRLLGEC